MTAVSASMPFEQPWQMTPKPVDLSEVFRAHFLLDARDHERDSALSGNPRIAIRGLPISTSSSTSSLTELDAGDHEAGKKRIYSGHFMSTHVYDDNKHLDAESDGGMTDDEGECEMLGMDKSLRASLTSNPEDDAYEISSLFENLTLSNRTKLTTPKWNNFKGLKLRSRIKVRLNNVLWRVWHIQFVKRKHPLIAPFSNEANKIETRKTTESPVADWKYWHRRQNMVAIEYRRCRLFYRERIRGVRMPIPSPTVTGMTLENHMYGRAQPVAFYDAGLIDPYSLPGFTTDTLFASLVTFVQPEPLPPDATMDDVSAIADVDLSNIMDMDITEFLRWLQSPAVAVPGRPIEPAVHVATTPCVTGGYDNFHPLGGLYQTGTFMEQPPEPHGHESATRDGSAFVNIPVPAHHPGQSTEPSTNQWGGSAQYILGNPQERLPPISTICDGKDIPPHVNHIPGRPLGTVRGPGIDGSSISSGSSGTRPKDKGVKKTPTMQNIYKLMGTLRGLIPRPHPTKRFSQRALLNGTIQHFKRLEQEIKDMRAEADMLKMQIASLDHTKNTYKQQPLSGIPVGDHVRKERMRAMLDEYTKKRAEENWKYWMFSAITGPLLDSYTSSVRGSTVEEISLEVAKWTNEQCNLPHLRSLLWDSLRHICLNTSIHTDPSRLPGEMQQAFQMQMASGSPGPFITSSMAMGYSYDNLENSSGS